MIRNKLFLAFAILVLSCFFMNGFASVLKNDSHKKRPGIEKKLIEQIKYIRKDRDFEKNRVFFGIDLYENNDTIFVNISYDFGPPLIMSDKVKLLGYSMYKNNVLVFMNMQLPDEAVNNLVDIKNLRKDPEEVTIRPYPIIEGQTYVYYVNELNDLIFVRKYRY